jgi:hypothetical protein
LPRAFALFYSRAAESGAERPQWYGSPIMAKPKDLSPAFWKSNVPKDLKVDPNTWKYLEFVHVHHIHYPKLNPNSKDSKVMYERMNQIRQMTAGLKKSAKAINDAIKACQSPKHDKFKTEVLMTYLELLRTAERDRQNWIKLERGLGNTENLKTMVQAQGLDTLVRI